jgi:hypothetical protein
VADPKGGIEVKPPSSFRSQIITIANRRKSKRKGIGEKELIPQKYK